MHTYIHMQPIPLQVTFSKAFSKARSQSSWVFCALKYGEHDLRALASSVGKCHWRRDMACNFVCMRVVETKRYRDGLALLTRNSMRFSITMHSLSGAVNSILGDNCTLLNSRGSAHSTGTSPSLHQAVTWSLSSPFYNDVIHLTGVYIFPNEGNLEEFFDILTAHSNHPCHEPHIY